MPNISVFYLLFKLVFSTLFIIVGALQTGGEGQTKKTLPGQLCDLVAHLV